MRTEQRARRTDGQARDGGLRDGGLLGGPLAGGPLVGGPMVGGRMLGSLALSGLLAMGPAASAAGAKCDTGDATRGAAIVASRSQGLCGLCHALPGQPDHLQGTIAPPLHGVGARHDAADLRAHLLTPERFNPDSVMPAYGRSEGLTRIAPAQRGKPLLDAQQIDDVVAYLASLR